jgi:3-phenylpropionate/cinnamic acid dioxygenase small subunit
MATLIVPAARTAEAPRFAASEIELFLMHEARLLDERRFEEWMALFTEDGTYWVPAVPGQDSPFNQASLFYDDRDLMRTRVARLGHPKIHIQTPASRTMHQIGRPLLEETSGDECLVSSTLLMVESRADVQRVFAGRQYHRLKRDGESFRIVQKRVDLVNCDSAFEAMAVPI